VATSTARQILEVWQRAERPLKSLPKHQLWKYPQANNTPDGEWAFSTELLARIMGYRAKEADHAAAVEEHRQALQLIRSTGANLAQHKAKEGEHAATGRADEHTQISARLERAVANAKERAERLGRDADEMKAVLDNCAALDDVVSPAEANVYYRNRYAGEWRQILDEWMRGSFMAAQTYGWASFLGCSNDEAAKDAKAYWQAEGIAKLVCENEGELFKSMTALYQIRVAPGLAARRVFLSDNKPDGVVIVASLKPEQAAQYWAWEKRYTAATKEHGWMDDGMEFNTNPKKD